MANTITFNNLGDLPDLGQNQIDQASATVTYIGTSYPGVATSEQAWLIQKITVSGTITTVAWLNADTNGVKYSIWDNRASY